MNRPKAHSFLISGLVAMALVSTLLLVRPAHTAQAKTVAELVESPALPDVRSGEGWRYETEYFLGNVYTSIKNNNFSTASEFANRILAEQPDNDQMLRLAVYVDLRLQKWSSVEAHLSRLLAAEPDDIPARLRRALSRANLQQWAAALEDYELALASQPSPEVAQYIRDSINLTRQRAANWEKDAQAEWARLEADRPALEAAGQRAELENRLDKYILMRPDDLQAHLIRGRIRLERGRLVEAQEDFTLVLNRSQTRSDEITAAAGLAKAEKEMLAEEWAEAESLKRSGDFEALEKHLNRMLALQPGNAAILAWRGETRLRLGDEHLTAAGSDLTEALAGPYLTGEERAHAAELMRQAGLRESEIQAQTKAAAEERPAGFTGDGNAEFASAEAPPPGAAISGPDWDRVQKTEQDLRNRRDTAGLDNYYSRLIQEHPDFAYAYVARAYLRFYGPSPETARADFQQALRMDLDPKAKSDLQAALTELDQRRSRDRAARSGPQASPAELEQRRARDRAAQALAAREGALVQSEDWWALERLYARESAARPDDARLRFRLGLARLDVGLVDRGQADLRAALALKADDENLNRDIRRLLQSIEAREASGRPAGSGRAEIYLGQAFMDLGSKRYDRLALVLPKLDDLILSGSQIGRRDYLQAQLLWASGDYENAKDRFLLAAVNQPDDFFLSETYGRLAEYYLRANQPHLAWNYVQQGLAITPDFVWRRIQAGDILSILNQPRPALDYYQAVLAGDAPPLEDRYFYGSMARSYLKLGDRGNFDAHMRKHIDSEVRRLDLKSANCGGAAEPLLRLACRPPDDLQRHGVSDEELAELRRQKKTLTDGSREYGGSLYAFGNAYRNGDHLSAFTGELKKMTSVGDYRTELYLRAGGTLSSSFSGSYFDPWIGRDLPYSGRSHFKDSIYAGLGGRIFPFDSSGFNLGLEHDFKLGRDTDSDTFLYLNIFEAIGNEWEPVKNNWFFASIYSQVNYSLSHNDFTYGGDGRLGRSFRLDGEGLLTLTPFVGLSGDYGGENVDKGGRWGLETGPGVIFRKWVREEDPYKIPHSSVDLAIQYRWGLSHERGDVLSVSLYYSF